MFAVGAGDRVVAADEFSYYPPETADLPRLAYSSPDPERALALAPDLVIMATPSARADRAVPQPRHDRHVHHSGDSLDGMFESIERLGRITGNREQAAELVASMRARIDAVTEAIGGVEEGPRTFFELTADLYTVGVETFVGNVLTLARAQNVATGASSPFPQLSAEAIIAADPESCCSPTARGARASKRSAHAPAGTPPRRASTSACTPSTATHQSPRPARGRGPRGDRAAALPEPLSLSPPDTAPDAILAVTWRSSTATTVESVLLRPERVVKGETADEYSGRLEDGRRAIIVVSRGRVPRTVIT